jgi:hypothetical protein
MLSLLAALLLSGPQPALAQDNPDPPVSDSRDTDGDGAVSGKERRTARRAARRARRAARGQAPQTDAEMDAEDAKEASDRGGAAANGASSAAESMKNSMTSADAGGGIPPGGGAGSPPKTGGSAGAPATTPPPAAGPAAGGKETAFGSGSTGDPGRPRSASDFALAARSGYAPAFAAAGLKVGPDGRSVMRLDGRPATPEDYARLQREIASMPAALGRRPDFFSIVSPEHYADLKRGYKEKKDGDPVYKDVGTTAGDRDFVHTASCDKLSGDCNKSVEKASYKKGDFVAPEDLDSMWSALQKELDGSAEPGGLPNPGAIRSVAARDTALGAAKALSPENSDQPTSPSGDKIPNAPAASPVAAAVASVQRLWKSAFSVPSTGGAKGTEPGPPLALGALALAALAGGALFLRRKG